MKEGRKPSRKHTLYLAVPADAEGVKVVGDWDPLGMRGGPCRVHCCCSRMFLWMRAKS